MTAVREHDLWYYTIIAGFQPNVDLQIIGYALGCMVAFTSISDFYLFDNWY